MFGSHTPRADALGVHYAEHLVKNVYAIVTHPAVVTLSLSLSIYINIYIYIYREREREREREMHGW